MNGVDQARRRLDGFDWLRAAGAFAVVWIHGCDTSSLARQLSSLAGFAVPCFVLMSFFLLQDRIGRDAAPKAMALAWRRLARLAPAYLGWTLIYLVARWLKHRAGGAGFEPEWLSWVFLGGASYQLYFVPLLIYFSILLLPLMTWAAAPGRRAWGVGLMGGLSVLLLGAATAFGGHSLVMHWPFQLRQMIGMAWLAALGSALALAWPSGVRLGPSKRAAFASAALVGSVWVGCVAAGVGGAAFTILMTLPAFLAALIVPSQRPPAWLMRVSAMSFGIYLSHGVWVEGLQMIAVRAGFALEYFPATLGVIVLSFAGAWLTCEVLDRFRSLRWLVH